MNYREPLGAFLTTGLVFGAAGAASNAVNHYVRRNAELKARRKMAATEAQREAITRIIENNEQHIRKLQEEARSNLDKKSKQNMLTLAAAGAAALIGIVALTN